ncbi:MAG: hypothetical protein JW850_23615 [Thermoflexales bacterium]|nr:hypothetical protein [Thermoflexales bacterium]
MQEYKVDITLRKAGALVLDKLPFQAGDYVQVIVRRISQLRPNLPELQYPLRGTVLRYDDPFAPVAEMDWEALR